MSKQELQERELARRQVDRAATARHGGGGRVERQVPGFKDSGPFGAASPYEGAQASEKLPERERFDEVVVGARIQASDPVLDPVARRQHQDRCPPAVRPQLPTHGEPVAAGKGDVEDDGVVVLGGAPAHRVFSVRDGVDRVALLLEAASKHLGHLGFVFHEEDPHAGSFAPLRESRVRDSRARRRSHRPLIELAVSLGKKDLDQEAALRTPSNLAAAVILGALVAACGGTTLSSQTTGAPSASPSTGSSHKQKPSATESPVPVESPLPTESNPPGDIPGSSAS